MDYLIAILANLYKIVKAFCLSTMSYTISKKTPPALLRIRKTGVAI